MEPKEYDFEFPRGDTCPLSLTLRDKEGNVLIPESGDEIYFTVKKSYRDSEVLLQKRYSTGDMTVNNEKIGFALTHSDTARLPYGKYYYDVQLKSGDYVKTLLIGSISLTNEATWIDNE